MKTSTLLAYILLYICLTEVSAADVPPVSSFHAEPLSYERLPDMHVPRFGHAAFYAGGELVVAGGHTSGFVPTATAERLSGGHWHLMDMVYTHDNGLCVVMSNGSVLLAGGHSEPLGIGQTFTAETYDPATRRFTGFGCLDRKRALAVGVEIDSGRMVIAGNHSASDAIELFDGKKENEEKASDLTRKASLCRRRAGSSGAACRWSCSRVR